MPLSACLRVIACGGPMACMLLQYVGHGAMIVCYLFRHFENTRIFFACIWWGICFLSTFVRSWWGPQSKRPCGIAAMSVWYQTPLQSLLAAVLIAVNSWTPQRMWPLSCVFEVSLTFSPYMFRRFFLLYHASIAQVRSGRLFDTGLTRAVFSCLPPCSRSTCFEKTFPHTGCHAPLSKCHLHANYVGGYFADFESLQLKEIWVRIHGYSTKGQRRKPRIDLVFGPFQGTRRHVLCVELYIFLRLEEKR